MYDKLLETLRGGTRVAGDGRRHSKKEKKDRRASEEARLAHKLERDQEWLRARNSALYAKLAEMKDTNTDHLFIPVVLPSGFGKTTIATMFNWLDVDDLVSDQVVDQERDQFWGIYNANGWTAAMEHRYTAVRRALNAMPMHEPIVLFTHSVTCTTVLGLVPKVRIVPTERFENELTSMMCDSDKKLTRANCQQVRMEEDTATAIIVDNFEQISDVIRALAHMFDMGTHECDRSLDEIVRDYEADDISRYEADRLVGSHKKSYQGFGCSVRHWARAVARVNDVSRPQRKGGKPNLELFATAARVDAELALTIRNNNDGSNGMQDALLAVVIGLEEYPDLRSAILPLFRVSVDKWDQVMRPIGQCAKRYSNMMGYRLNDSERQIMTDLWILAPTRFYTCVARRVHGAGRSYRPSPGHHDVRKALEFTKLKGGATVRETLLQNLRGWYSTLGLVEVDSPVTKADEAFSDHKGSEWYDLCRHTYINESGSKMGVWLAKAVTFVAPEAIDGVDWKERVEVIFQVLLSRILAAYAARVRLVRDSYPPVSEDDDALVCSLANLGLSQHDLGRTGMADKGVMFISEISDLTNSLVAIAKELTEVGDITTVKRAMRENLWQRADRLGAARLAKFIRKNTGNGISDKHMRANVERACSPQSTGGSGLLSIEGKRYTPNAKWGANRPGGQWRKVRSDVMLRGVTEDVMFKSDAEVKKIAGTPAVFTLGLAGGLITKGDISLVSIAVGKMVDYSVIGKSALPSVADLWELPGLFEAVEIAKDRASHRNGSGNQPASRSSVTAD
jgi:hypothetical protein